MMRRRLLRRLQGTKPNLFATLTTSERTAPTPRQAFERANAAFAILIKRWRRRYPNDRLEYFLVWELTKRGWPHAHVLLIGQRPSKHWLSHTWHELTGSYIIDLQPVSSLTHAVSYLAKYLAKDPAVPPGFRRWRRSAGFWSKETSTIALRLKPGSRWQRSNLPSWAQAYLWVSAGYFVSEDLAGRIRASPDSLRRSVLMTSSWWDNTVAKIASLYPGLLRSEHALAP